MRRSLMKQKTGTTLYCLMTASLGYEQRA